ncbi:MAG: hypothetical protein M3R66_20105, partial [Actinomycetota bacterium]|nr:hypothetical protein [Actinomycetota bacterium]
LRTKRDITYNNGCLLLPLVRTGSFLAAEWPWSRDGVGSAKWGRQTAAVGTGCGAYDICDS